MSTRATAGSQDAPGSVVPMLPTGCGYTGNDFGASYPDAECFGGWLYDLDNCDGEGNLYEPITPHPCPSCNHDEWLKQFKDAVENQGFEDAEVFLPRKYTHKPIRHEQRGDRYRMARWWYRGYDASVAESQSPNAVRSTTPGGEA